MNAIVVVVDRLHVGYLGCYGNTWVATPELNRLCVESCTFDQAIVDSPSLEEVYASFWSGSHVLQRSGGRLGGAALAAALAKAGVAATLISDDRRVSQHPLAADFGETIEVEPPQEHGAVSADDAGQTHLAGCFALAADWLERARGPFCLWLHTRGLAAPWDAPLELRNQYADADEAPPPPLVDVPCRPLADDFDPDERFGVCQAYAGQVSLLDACLGGLLAAISDGPFHDETLLTIVSPRGFPLGEHRRIGTCDDDALYNELIHVPWLLRLPDGCGAAARSQALVAPADLCATLCDWWGIAPLLPAGAGRSLLPTLRNEVESLRDRACVAAPGGEQGIRTAGWYLRLPVAGLEGSDVVDVDRAELYAKPDDFWELNDVADRCRDTVESLRRGLSDFRTAAESGTISDVPPLDASLVEDA